MNLPPIAFALFSAAALAMTLAPAKAASFNCAHAILAAEEAICGNHNLSRLD